MALNQISKDKKTQKRGFLKWYLILTTALIVVFCGLVGYASANYYRQALPNTYLLGKNIGGFDKKQAQDYFAQNQPFVVGTIKLKVNDQIVPVGANEIGINIDLDKSIDKALNRERTKNVIVNPKGLTALFGQKTNITPVFTIDEAVFGQKAREFLKDFEKTPANASITVENGQVTIKQDVKGAKIDTGDASLVILKYLPTGHIPVVDIGIVEVPAEVTANQIAGIKDYLVTHLPAAIGIYNGDTKINTMDIASIVSVLNQAELQKGNIKIDQSALNGWVSKKIAAKINVAAKPTQISSVDNSVLDPGQSGKSIDQTKLATSIANIIANNTPDARIQIEVTETPPETQIVYPGYTPGKYPGRYIEINLDQQMLYLFEGTNMVGSFRISSGKWSMPTPSGEFQILDKTPRAYSVKYGLYMPWWMAFTNQGHGIHELPEWPGGAKEGESHLGTPVSHGCVRLGVGAAQTAYDFAAVGTPVYVHR
jgi:lipoprotein-anchoring transpeptidase ErfK/SrfK